jgi:6-pyruvoyltetrahydropterin/6-carboxytetrahydropterin synthase
VYELTVQSCFAAAHAIVMGGIREPIHGHNWDVRVVIRAPRLDADGLLCDFHAVEKGLAAIIARFHNRHLNEVEPFTTINPTAELVARHIALELAAKLGPVLAPQDGRIAKVSVTEAPGCTAAFEPD